MRCANHNNSVAQRVSNGSVVRGSGAGAGLRVLGRVCFLTRGDLRSGKCGGRDGGDRGEGIPSGVGPRGVARCFGIGGGIMRAPEMVAEVA